MAWETSTLPTSLAIFGPISVMIVAVLVVIFSALFIWYSRDTCYGFWVYWAPFFLTLVAFALGVPVYTAQRR